MATSDRSSEQTHERTNARAARHAPRALRILNWPRASRIKRWGFTTCTHIGTISATRVFFLLLQDLREQRMPAALARAHPTPTASKRCTVNHAVSNSAPFAVESQSHATGSTSCGIGLKQGRSRARWKSSASSPTRWGLARGRRRRSPARRILIWTSSHSTVYSSGDGHTRPSFCKMRPASAFGGFALKKPRCQRQPQSPICTVIQLPPLVWCQDANSAFVLHVSFIFIFKHKQQTTNNKQRWGWGPFAMRFTKAKVSVPGASARWGFCACAWWWCLYLVFGV